VGGVGFGCTDPGSVCGSVSVSGLVVAFTAASQRVHDLVGAVGAVAVPSSATLVWRTSAFPPFLQPLVHILLSVLVLNCVGWGNFWCTERLSVVGHALSPPCAIIAY
jgi:hypothetical protein